MRFAIFFLTVYIAVVLAFAGLLAAAIVLISAAAILVFESMYEFLTDKVPYWDSEDIGREVRPYVQRVNAAEVLVAVCILLLITYFVLI